MKTFEAMPTEPRNCGAFTRWDLLAVLGCCALLLGVTLPAWSGAEAQDAMEACRNNLRQIGQAFAGWSRDHDQRMPWNVPGPEGGTHGLPIAGNAWVQLWWLTNYLKSPAILACPADAKARPAKDWSRQPEGGFLHGNYRGQSVSYLVGLDVQPNSPKAILSGDSNLKPSARGQVCDAARVNNAVSLAPGKQEVAWTFSLHGNPGNLLRNSGEVETLTSQELREALPKTEAVHPDNHVLLAR